MTFWTQPDFSPISKYQFIFNIGPQQFTVNATTITLPTYSTEGFTSRLMNHEVKYPGIGHWDDLVVSFILTENLRQSTFMALTEYNNYSSNKGTVPKFTLAPNIKIIGKAGDTINEWTFKGAYIKQINFGDMDYSADDFATVEMTISVDYASVNGSGASSIAVTRENGESKAAQPEEISPIQESIEENTTSFFDEEEANQEFGAGQGPLL